ncbi:MAG TPA: amidohydrolase family protein, partial [Longimicrobiales bacterium]|nr:amidohydrolase family protein [Longimicrobiales bacterium]
RGAEELDLRGLALAPGFIDIHSHADLSLLVEPRAESRIRQGVTLEVVGQDGSSVGPWSEEAFRSTRESYRERYGVDIDFRDLGGFLDRLDRTPPTVNLASMVGQGTVRSRVVGGEDRPATAAELARMRGLIREALLQGAVGLSSGLEYTPGSFAPTEELVALASELKGTGLPYASHMRNEDDRVLAAVEETLHVGRLAGVPVEVSHLKAQGRRNYWKADVILGLLERVRADGVDVHFDRYPYVAYATGLSNLFPTWAREGGARALVARLADPEAGPALERYARDKVALLGSWDAVQITSAGAGEDAWLKGRRLGEAAAERSVDPFELVVRLLRGEGGVGMIGYGMSEENTEKILAHPLGMICSDGGAFAPYGPLSGSSPHPRAYGTFPRLLGVYVRERRVMSLERAIHKITGMPAAKLGLEDRGAIRPGAFADLVAFDPATIADGATFT